MSLRMLSNVFLYIKSLIKPKRMYGIDVSHHQGKIDWNKVATANTPKVEFVYIKASTGVGSIDPKALYNATEAKKNGLKIGYYHYCSLNNEDELQDSTDEANWFIKTMKGLPQADLPAVLDIEDPQILSSLDDGEVLAWIKNFFKVLSNSGYKYVLYSYSPFLDQHLPANHGLGDVPLWIAQYRTSLTLPKGWSKYYLWQFSAKGKINGISTDVDLNKS